MDMATADARILPMNDDVRYVRHSILIVLTWITLTILIALVLAQFVP